MADEKNSGFGMGSLLVAGLAGAAAGYFVGSGALGGGQASGAPRVSGGTSKKELAAREYPVPAEGAAWYVMDEDQLDAAFEAEGNATSGTDVQIKSCSLKKLKALLGDPMEGDGEKTRYEWYIAPEEGEGFVNVYDWRESAKSPTTWNIGAPKGSDEWAESFIGWLQGVSEEEGLGEIKVGRRRE